MLEVEARPLSPLSAEGTDGAAPGPAAVTVSLPVSGSVSARGRGRLADVHFIAKAARPGLQPIPPQFIPTP